MLFNATAVFCCCTAALVTAPAIAQASSQNDRAALAQLVELVQAADYAGDLSQLRSLAGQMQPYAANPSLALATHYWTGFAHWRHALNSMNEDAPAESVDRDFEQAIIEFRKMLQIDPKNIEAKIGLAAGLSNRGYFNLKTPELAAQFMTESAPLIEELKRSDNPRAIFVVAPTLYWTPLVRGGDKAKAIAMLERGTHVAAAIPASNDVIEPSWGLGELHMLLAYFAINLNPPDGEKATVHSQAALELHPDWHYVKDILIPQIQRRTE